MVSPNRVLRIDLLRGAAIFAMLMAHANSLLPGSPRVWGFAVGQLNDLASPLFALVMGMAAQLVFTRDTSRGTGRYLLHQLLRGAILLALGMWAATWGSWVDVVLAYLGLLIVVCAPVVMLRTRWIITLGVLTALSGPLLNEWARTAIRPDLHLQHWFVQDLANWTLLGYNYRLTNLIPLFLLGVLLHRMPLRSWRAASWVFLVAVAGYLVGPVLVHLFKAAEPISGSFSDQARDLGLVLFAYLVAYVLENWAEVKRGWAAVVAFGADLGKVALSLYLVHVWIISLAAGWGWRGSGTHLPGWLVLVPGMVLLGVGWQRIVGPGPVEWLMKTLLRPLRNSGSAMDAGSTQSPGSANSSNRPPAQ